MTLNEIPIETVARPDAETIDQWLPQTQCTLCGYPRCYEYARAIANNQADINQCPPGGDITIEGLADLLQVESKPLNPDNGEHRPRHSLVIDEQTCIGCTLCIQVCPVDAVIGARKLMHTIVPEECTGCDLCLPVCPVDCIDVFPSPKPKMASSWRWPEYSPTQTQNARQRTQARVQRLSDHARTQALSDKHIMLRRSPNASAVIRADIDAALARVRKS